MNIASILRNGESCQIINELKSAAPRPPWLLRGTPLRRSQNRNKYNPDGTRKPTREEIMKAIQQQRQPQTECKPETKD